MATSYATPVALSGISRAQSLADTQAATLGEVQHTGDVINIRLKIPINSLATGGYYTIYMVESQDGVNWTDDIDPTDDTGDVAAKISDARPITPAIRTDYDATNRLNAEFHFNVQALDSAEYVGFVLLNNSNQTIPASGAAGHYSIGTVS